MAKYLAIAWLLADGTTILLPMFMCLKEERMMEIGTMSK